MARNKENTRHSKYVIRIVCEGKKTEPLFFTSLCDMYCKDNEGMDVRTVPQPYIPQNEDKDSFTRGNYRGKKRKIKSEGNDSAVEAEISGTPPLKWVLYARQILSEGVDESWAVYDKDNHPKHKEAWEEALKNIDGKKVNVAFSSRSFEYYLLLHFEYIYKAFDETECGEKIQGKKQIFECGTGKRPAKECFGNNCINGYARKNGYWKETKSSESTFPLVKDNLVKGMINASRLRLESDDKSTLPVYNRNPYTNVDMLVGRLIGIETVSYGIPYEYTEHGCKWSVRFDNNELVITNRRDRLELFNKDMFTIYDWEVRSRQELLQKNLLLQSNETKSLPCKLKPTQVISIKISSEKEILLLPYFSRQG